METNINNFFLDKIPNINSQKPQNSTWLFFDFPYELTNFKEIEYEIGIKNGETFKINAESPKHNIKIGSANLIFEMLCNKCYLYPSNANDFVGILAPSKFEVANNEIIKVGNFIIQFDLSPENEKFFYWSSEDPPTFQKPKKSQQQKIDFKENLFELHALNKIFDSSKQLIIMKKEKKFILRCSFNYVTVFFQNGIKRKLDSSTSSNKIFIGKESYEINLNKTKI